MTKQHVSECSDLGTFTSMPQKLHNRYGTAKEIVLAQVVRGLLACYLPCATPRVQYHTEPRASVLNGGGGGGRLVVVVVQLLMVGVSGGGAWWWPWCVMRGGAPRCVRSADDVGS